MKSKVKKTSIKKLKTTNNGNRIQNGGTRVNITDPVNSYAFELDIYWHSYVYELKNYIMTHIGIPIEQRFFMILENRGEECLDYMRISSFQEPIRFNLSIRVLNIEEQQNKIIELFNLNRIPRWYVREINDNVFKNKIITDLILCFAKHIVLLKREIDNIIKRLISLI